VIEPHYINADDGYG
jgi:lysosomal acid lipase/cholesteryl ester hydrolase